MKARFAAIGLVLSALGSVACGAAALDAAVGRGLFKRAWLPAPASTRSNDGLGPLFNARACVACHQGLERPAIEADRSGNVTGPGLVLRLSDPNGRGDPVYGVQLQTSALPGVSPEGKVRIAGSRFEPDDLRYGPLGPATRSGARIATALAGLGGLEAIAEDEIRARADPDDRDRDGVRGRINTRVDRHGNARIGRFGWKAQSATIAEHVAVAFANDLGLSTRDFSAPWGDCTPAQTACRAAPQGGSSAEPEIAPEIVAALAQYLAAIPPPGPPAQLSLVSVAGPSGDALFRATGCAACHVPAMPSAQGPVRAYTDLLLHEMGPELDGGATEPGVAATEWRTAPLWGLSRTLANGAGLLHDARAQTIEQAVRFHGGEAAASRRRFDALTPREKQQLVEFLRSL